MRLPVLMIACSAMLWAQRIEGDVYDRLTGAPVAGARVFIQQSGTAERLSGRSDAAGHFSLTAAGPAPRYLPATILRDGYLRSDILMLSAQDGSAIEVRIGLTPQAVISGRIEDEDGFPAERVHVLAMRLTAANDRRKLKQVQTVLSDDLGRFRLSELPPGRFFLYFVPQDMSTTGWDGRYTAEYYPDTLDVNEATRVEVRAGQEVSDIKMKLTRHEGVTVSGRLAQPGGSAPDRFRGIALRMNGPAGQGTVRGAPMNADGSFILLHIQPGTYTLMTTNSYNAALGETVASMPLTVGSSDVPGLELQGRIVQAFDVAGKIVADAGSLPGSRIVGLIAMNGQRKLVHSGLDGSFVLKGVMPGTYRVYAGLTTDSRSALLPMGARLGERIIPRSEPLELDGMPSEPLEVLVADLSGQQPVRLQDASGRPVAGGTVRFLGASYETEIIAPTSATGETSVSAAPGEYKVYATTAPISANLLDDPDFLAAHQKDFAPVRIAAGKNQTLVLTLMER